MSELGYGSVVANTYAANFGDVVKHAVLCEVVVRERPPRYLESHGGRLVYDLAGLEPGPGGVWDFLELASDHDDLSGSTYAELIRRKAGTRHDPGKYPGGAGGTAAPAISLGYRAGRHAAAAISGAAVEPAGGPRTMLSVIRRGRRSSARSRAASSTFEIGLLTTSSAPARSSRTRSSSSLWSVTPMRSASVSERISVK